jgi:hypothetical protein
MYTDLAIERMETFSKFYPTLYKFYQPMMGNFCLTEKQLNSNMKDVLKFLKDYEDYFLLHQDDYFYITDFLE